MFQIPDSIYHRYLVVASNKNKVRQSVWRETYEEAMSLRGALLAICDDVEVGDFTGMDNESGYSEYVAARKRYADYPCAVWCVQLRRAWKSDERAMMTTGDTRYYIKRSCKTGKPAPSGRIWRFLSKE